MTPLSSDDGAEAGHLLRHGPYVAFWTARLFSSFGLQIQAVTIAWEVYGMARLNHTVREAAFAVGMIGLAQFLPVIALTLPAGALADRHDRRLIACTALGVEAVSAAALTGLASSGWRAVWPIYLAAMLFGSARTFLNPATTSLAPMLVPRALLPRAIAFSSLSLQSATIIGPAVGGLLCAISPAAGFAASLACYLAAAGRLALIRAETRPIRQESSRWTLVKEGLAYVWNAKIVFGAISLDLFAVLLGGATALLPVYARDVLQIGSTGFGVLRSGPAIGAGLVATVLALRPIRRKAGLIMFAGVATFGTATCVFAASKSLALSVAALAVLGGADMLSVYVRQTLVQLVTPDPMRGRVAAVSSLFVGASNEFGEFESGVAARFLGPVGAALFGGVGSLMVTLLWAKLFPDLRKADRLA